MGTAGVTASRAMVAAHPRPLSWPLLLMGSTSSICRGIPWVTSMGSVAEAGGWVGVAGVVATRTPAEADPEPCPGWPRPPAPLRFPSGKVRRLESRREKMEKVKLCWKSNTKGWQRRAKDCTCRHGNIVCRVCLLVDPDNPVVLGTCIFRQEKAKSAQEGQSRPGMRKKTWEQVTQCGKLRLPIEGLTTPLAGGTGGARGPSRDRLA
jgi:hypothetical protein